MTGPLRTAVEPWYRHRWPWLLMAGPLAVVVAGVFTAYLAVSSNDGLVDDDYYKHGLAVNKLGERDRRAAELGLQAEVMQRGDGAQLRLLLRSAPDVALPGELVLRLAHPTRGGADQRVVLHADGGGLYSGQLAAPLTGRWHLALEDDRQQWRLTGTWRIEQNDSLRLSSEADTAAPDSSLKGGK